MPSTIKTLQHLLVFFEYNVMISQYLIYNHETKSLKKGAEENTMF